MLAVVIKCWHQLFIPHQLVGSRKYVSVILLLTALLLLWFYRYTLVSGQLDQQASGQHNACHLLYNAVVLLHRTGVF